MVREQHQGDIYVFLNIIFSTPYIFFAILAPDRCTTGHRFNLLTLDFCQFRIHIIVLGCRGFIPRNSFNFRVLNVLF